MQSPEPSADAQAGRRTVRAPREVRRRWDGCGLSRARSRAWCAGRAQDAARRDARQRAAVQDRVSIAARHSPSEPRRARRAVRERRPVVLHDGADARRAAARVGARARRDKGPPSTDSEIRRMGDDDGDAWSRRRRAHLDDDRRRERARAGDPVRVRAPTRASCARRWPGSTSGLAALHAAGKIHRDVKPSNVLVDDTGRAVLLDFGVVAELPVSAFDDKLIIGTVSYMAPEQARGDAVGPAADWYALGVVLFQALTGPTAARGDLRCAARVEAAHPGARGVAVRRRARRSRAAVHAAARARSERAPDRGADLRVARRAAHRSRCGVDAGGDRGPVVRRPARRARPARCGARGAHECGGRGRRRGRIRASARPRSSITSASSRARPTRRRRSCAAAVISASGSRSTRSTASSTSSRAG